MSKLYDVKVELSFTGLGYDKEELLAAIERGLDKQGLCGNIQVTEMLEYDDDRLGMRAIDISCEYCADKGWETDMGYEFGKQLGHDVKLTDILEEEGSLEAFDEWVLDQVADYFSEEE